MAPSSREVNWPERLTLRDTGVQADEGQWIYTTATGHGYAKCEYIRADKFEKIIKECEDRIDALFECKTHWVHEDTPKGKPIGKYLMMGDVELVCLRPARKWWQTIHWLPGISSQREYGPLESQMAEAERLVRNFFKQGNYSK